MTKLMRGLAMIAALLAAGWLASPALAEKPAQPKKAGVLHVYGKLTRSSSARTASSRPSGICTAHEFDRGLIAHSRYLHEVPARQEGRGRRGQEREGPVAIFHERLGQSSERRMTKPRESTS